MKTIGKYNYSKIKWDPVHFGKNLTRSTNCTRCARAILRTRSIFSELHRYPFNFSIEAIELALLT